MTIVQPHRGTTSDAESELCPPSGAILECPELGEPLTYKALPPNQVPLSESQIWPDLKYPERLVEMIEAKGSMLIGAVQCDGHGNWIQALPCDACGAIV